MYSSSFATDDADIEFVLHFLDCQPTSVTRSLNSASVMDHLYRAATNRLWTSAKSYDREECDRVTDIDQLIMLDSVVLRARPAVRHIPVQVTKPDRPHVILPVVRSSSIEKPAPLVSERRTETVSVIPSAPPLPVSLDVAIKMQTQARQASMNTPNRETLWADVSDAIHSLLGDASLHHRLPVSFENNSFHVSTFAFFSLARKSQCC